MFNSLLRLGRKPRAQLQLYNRVLQLGILVPDVLGAIAFALLNCRCDAIKGSSVVDETVKILQLKHEAMMLGDVQPHADIGPLRLVIPTKSGGDGYRAEPSCSRRLKLYNSKKDSFDKRMDEG